MTVISSDHVCLIFKYRYILDPSQSGIQPRYGTETVGSLHRQPPVTPGSEQVSAAVIA